MERSDESLIDAINKGDSEAFEKLYHRYRDWVYRLAWRFTGDENKAQDVLQETFVYVLSKVPNLHLTAKMTTFLYPAVKHISFRIAEKTIHIPLEETDDEPACNIDMKVVDGQSDIGAVLAALPAKQQEVILLRYVDDFSVEEIAESLGVPAGTVKSRLNSALKRLREEPRTKKYFFE